MIPSYLRTHQPTNPPTHSLTCLLTYLPPTHSLTYLLTYLPPTHLLTYLPPGLVQAGLFSTIASPLFFYSPDFRKVSLTPSDNPCIAPHAHAHTLKAHPPPPLLPQGVDLAHPGILRPQVERHQVERHQVGIKSKGVGSRVKAKEIKL